MGDPRHARPDAPRRRPREGGRQRATSTTRPRTTRRWSTSAPRRSPASPTTSRPLEVVGDADADLCVLGWGSTWAAIDAAVQRTRRRGREGGVDPPDRTSTRCRANLGELLRSFPKVIVPELNLGQLCRIVRAEYLVDARPVTKVQGLPFTAAGARRPPSRRRCHDDDTHRPAHHEEGLDVSDQEVRWCPGCGDYGDPAGRADADARARRRPAEHRVRQRHRLLQPLPVLHEHLRDAQHPRSCAGASPPVSRSPARTSTCG